MAQAAVEGVTRGAAPARRAASPAAGAIGLAGSVALAVLSGTEDAALAPLLGLAMLLGAVFVLLDLGFTSGFRDLLVAGDGRALAASLAVPAVAALVVVPMAMLGGTHGRYVAPIGLPLLAGAAVFGAGMQIALGCGSGTLVAAGAGSRRSWVVLPCFCAGGVLGSLILPGALRLPDLGTVDLPVLLGPWGGLLATEALLALAALALVWRHGGAPPRGRVLASALGARWPRPCSWSRASPGASPWASRSGAQRRRRSSARTSRAPPSGPGMARARRWPVRCWRCTVP